MNDQAVRRLPATTPKPRITQEGSPFASSNMLFATAFSFLSGVNRSKDLVCGCTVCAGSYRSPLVLGCRCCWAKPVETGNSPNVSVENEPPLCGIQLGHWLSGDERLFSSPSQ